MDNIYLKIQEEFFAILETSKLFSEVNEIEKGRFALSNRFPTETNHFLVKTSKGWQPTPIQWVENLLDDISEFWKKNANKLYVQISNSPLNFIQTEPILIEKGLRKFGCFFDAILVPDQLLLLHNEHYSERPLVDWQSLVLSTLRILVTYFKNRELPLPSDGRPRVIIVPPKRIIDKKYSKQASRAALTLSEIFFSELSNRDIKDSRSFVEIWEKSGENSMNKGLLNRIYHRYNATNFNDYFEKQRKQTISEHGAPTIFQEKEPRVLQMILDVTARFSEFERSHGEAFIWGQEAEIPDDDTILFEWWLKESSKTLSSIAGSRLSENDIVKLGIQSQEMSFLKQIEIKQLIELMKTDPAEKLREDLKLNRVKMCRSNTMDLNRSIKIIGTYMEERLYEFQRDLTTLKGDLSKELKREWVDLGISMVISFASVLFPPLSAFSAVYGGNLATLNKKMKKNRAILKSIKERPIATFADWKLRS